MTNLDLDSVRSSDLYNLKSKIKDDDFEEDNSNNDSIYSGIGHDCSYLEPGEFKNKLASRASKKGFSYYSHNVHSLCGSWQDLNELLINLQPETFKFSCIALQEIWNVPPSVALEDLY